MKYQLLVPKSQILYSAITLAILGLLLLLLNTRHENKYIWSPVEIPLRISAGEIVRGRFVAVLNEPHEIEIEFQRLGPAEILTKFVKVKDEPSPLDIKWSVFNSDKVVAEGTCRDYLYLSADSGSLIYKLVRRVKRMILNRRYRQGGSITRGIGKFDCKAGNQYNLRMEVGTTVEELNVTNPTFRVRVNRLFEQRHKLEKKPLAAGGTVALGLSTLAFCWWALTVLLKKMHA